jgi:quinol monooxygenase YgiN
VYGLITKLTTVPGRRESVIDVLARRRQPPEGCLSYVVAREPQDPDTLWVTEVWTDAAAHRASLKRPDIKAAFQSVLPWIATMHDSVLTEPVGGIGLG